MRPAEFEGFFFLCPGPDAHPDGWHRANVHSDDPHCTACGRPVTDGTATTGLRRWIYRVPFLTIEEEPV